MEFLITVLLVAALVYLVVRGSNSQKIRDLPKSQPEIGKYSAPKRSAQIVNLRDSRFDERSARELHHKRILTGRAWVTDGDTIKIKNTQVRLHGIDAPELNHPYGKQAKWALHKLCKGHNVRAEITEEDQYGRTVALCYLSDGRDLSAEMVKQGLAIDWPKFSGGKYKNLEPGDVRRKLFLADARQKGRMHVWEQFEAKRKRK